MLQGGGAAQERSWLSQRVISLVSCFARRHWRLSLFRLATPGKLAVATGVPETREQPARTTHSPSAKTIAASNPE
jgi:hypothetical protein